MSAAILESLENLLKEEKWTRTTINNYTIKNFEDLNDLIDQVKAENITSEVIDKTDEYLKNNKNSIIALYLNSILQFDTGNFDDSYILSLIKIFVDNLKWNIVEYLCKKGLLYSENKYMLRILIDSYSNTNKKDELPDLWERLIRVDFEEADMVVKLAAVKEEAKELDEAKSLYKKALNRYILNKNFTQVEELWKKLLSYEDTGYEYFLNIDKKISKHFSDERSIELLKYLYEVYVEKDEYDICLKVLKIILEKDPTDDFGRKEIVSIYRKKYKEHTYLEEYIKRNNLEGSWRNINDAIFNFEKHIAFDKGNFVYHRTWGIGRIVDVNRDIFTIDFTKKKGHQMSLNMALDSLRILPKNHIWILKMRDKDRLKSKIKEDIPWGLKILINSYDNKATMKNFKEELVPDILKLSEWNTWWNNAKKILKTDPKFGAIDELKDTYEM
ncbi:MAG TPA: transcription elongation factor GreA, partial [Spirochaetota bacterium]|nr:transcription elongation factor GreA [Spirochaetota bacterium]